jgi:hypothetical protein|tara:strand:- start:1730 stop:2143 length:414 start_codon:yes stop_codon:yes gene_type:complete
MKKILMMLLMIGSLSGQYEVVKEKASVTDDDILIKTISGFSVVEFCAGWAGVCTIDKFMDVQGYKGTKIFHADTKDTPKETRKNKLRTFPSVVLYKDGKPIAKWKASIDGKNVVTSKDIKSKIDNPPPPRRRRARTK